ncbi:MAG: hypothetical protein ACK5X3_01510 [Pseudomonadota bacterium]|jgi:hypothetical protein
MGTWTALVFNAVIKDDSVASDWFLLELDYKLGQFRDRRSCYFPAVKHYAVFKQEPTEYYEVENTVSICCSIKNYDNQIEDFLDWINPHLAEWQKPIQCLGYKQIMNDEKLPEFIFRRAYD